MWLNRPPNPSAIVLFKFSLPPSRCNAWLLWGSGWSTGAAIIIQHSQGKTRAQCQSICQPVVGEITRRALYWIPAEAERCPRDPEATAGQQWKDDSADEKSRLHTEPSEGGRTLKTIIFIHPPHTRTPQNHLLLLTYSQFIENKIYFLHQQSPGVTVSSQCHLLTIRNSSRALLSIQNNPGFPLSNFLSISLYLATVLVAECKSSKYLLLVSIFSPDSIFQGLLFPLLK